MSDRGNSARGRKRTLTDSARKGNRKDAQAAYQKSKIHIGDEIDRWNDLKDLLRLESHTQVAKLLLDRLACCLHLYLQMSCSKIDFFHISKKHTASYLFIYIQMMFVYLILHEEMYEKAIIISVKKCVYSRGPAKGKSELSVIKRLFGISSIISIDLKLKYHS